MKKVKVEQQEFYQSDFIGKFICLNKSMLQTLHFSKVRFINGMHECLQGMLGEELQLKSLIFECCDLGPTTIPDLTSALENLRSLEELHLIDMGIGKDAKIKDPNVQRKDNIKVLNLRNNSITDFREISEIIQNSRTLKTVDIRGNPLAAKGQFDDLIRGISRNISVSRVYFDLQPSHKIDEDRINALYDEIKKNEYIGRLIEWKNFSQFYLNHQSDLNLAGTKNLSKNIDAVIKLYKCLANKTELNLSSCKLENQIIEDVSLYLLLDYRNVLHKLDLSNNDIEDAACSTISRLIAAPYVELVNLDMSHNVSITRKGMLALLKGLSKDKYMHTLNLEGCNIDFVTSE